jgi:hypothetical protein
MFARPDALGITPNNKLNLISEQLYSRCVTDLKSTLFWQLGVRLLIRRFPEKWANLACGIICVAKEILDKMGLVLDCGYVLALELSKKGLFSGRRKLVKPCRDTALNLSKR